MRDLHSNCERILRHDHVDIRLADEGAYEWFYNEEHPHIEDFQYDIRARNPRGGYINDLDVDAVSIGKVDGYRISQDWTNQSDLYIWDEADALSQDAVTYVEAMIRELRAYEKFCGLGPDLTHGQHITIVRDISVKDPKQTARVVRETVAALVVKDTPAFILVDPWPSWETRKTEAGAASGASNIRALLKLGFSKMVGSRYLWGWDVHLAESLMADYSYTKMLRAKRSGKLKEVLDSSLADEVYGRGQTIPDNIKKQMGLPLPEDFCEETAPCGTALN
jgi:hypothetical protein